MQQRAGVVDDAVGAGARVLTGGKKIDGKGTLSAHRAGSRAVALEILTQEIFGPVAPVVEFDSEEEGSSSRTTPSTAWFPISTPATCGAGCASRNASKPAVGLNRGVVSDPAAPFGSVKQSGLGREGSHDGLLEFLEKKYIAADW